MSARLVIFDVDGTLVDSQAHITRAMHVAFENHDMSPPAPAAVRAIIGLSLHHAIAALAPADTPEPILLAIEEGYKAAFVRHRQEAGPDGLEPLFPQAFETLQALAERDDLLLGVATGKSMRGLRHILQGHGLEPWFSTIQVADHHPSKPHPSMVLSALSETGVTPENAVIVGDTSFDMEMGRNARIRGIGVRWGYHDPDTLQAAGATAQLDTFSQLPALLDDLWEGS